MINKNTLDLLNKLGFGADVDALESYMGMINTSLDMNNPLVSKQEYNEYKTLLSELKPDSEEIKEYKINKDKLEIDQYDKMYSLYDMSEYIEINEQSDITRIKQIISMANKSISITAILSAKSLRFRAVYVNGWLHRCTVGNVDITRQIKEILPSFIEDWRVLNLVEVRGELFIRDYKQLENKRYKTDLDALVSILSNSLPVENIELVGYHCSRLLTNDMLLESIIDELETLESVGINVPEYAVIKNVNKLNIEASINKLLQYFESVIKNDELYYNTNGIIISLNDIGVSDNYKSDFYSHTFLIKLGQWKYIKYRSTIKDIKFEFGTKYLEPYAIIDKVNTSIGMVDKLPLLSVGNIEDNEYHVGKEINFIIKDKAISIIKE